MNRIAAASLSVLLAAGITFFLTACGGGGGSSNSGITTPTQPPTQPASNVAISVTCPPQLQIGVTSPSTYACTATVSGSTNTGSSLALTGSGDTNRATLDPTTGILSPSNTNTGTITVTATANADSTKTATATVKVVDWILTTIPSGSVGYIGIMNSDGTGATKLFENYFTGTNMVCTSVSWRPDHLRFLCYAMGAYGTIDSLDTYQTDGTSSGTKKISSIAFPNPEADEPTFSPDGQTIVYAAVAGVVNNSAEMGVWTVDSGGKNAPVLVYSTPPNGHFDVPDHFTPDGKRITFWNPADQTIWIVNSDGSNPHQLIAANSYLPAIFSPDGTALYYNGTDGVYAAKADGSSAVRIAVGDVNSNTGYQLVDISPNGKSILLSYWQPLGAGQYNTDLWTADAATGANARQLLQGVGEGSWSY